MPPRAQIARREFPHLRLLLRPAELENLLFHPANLGWLLLSLKPCRFELGTLALIQYNKLSGCLFLNRPVNLSVTFSSHGNCDAASLVVMKGGHRTSAYRESNEFIEFEPQKSTRGIPLVLLMLFEARKIICYFSVSSVHSH